MSLYRMTLRRVKRVIAWLLAVVVLALLGLGAYYVIIEVGI